MEQGHSYEEAAIICETIEEFRKAGKSYDEARACAARRLKVARNSKVGVKGCKQLTTSFDPGTIGVELDRDSGRIVESPEGQAKNAGVKVGMRILKVQSADYSYTGLLE